jgi:hypothetical protein
MKDCDCNENMTNIIKNTNNESNIIYNKLPKKYINKPNINYNKLSKKYINDSNMNEQDNIKTLHTLRSFDDMNNFTKIETNEIFKNKDGRIEITNLASCTLPMVADYTTNINNMINDGNSIYQVMVKPSKHISLIGNKKHHLKQITWTKSHLNWANEKIPLEIRLTHINMETYQITHVIFPVKLIDSKIEGNTEGFFGLDMGKLEHKIENKYNIVKTDVNNSLTTNVNNIIKKDKLQDFDIDKLDLVKLKDNKVDELYNKLDKINFNEIAPYFNNQKFTPQDIHSFLNLNTLITDNSSIPSYSCCAPTYGKLIAINLCPTATKLTDQELYHIANGKDGSVILITKPYPFNRKIGKTILSNLNEGDELI